MIHCAIMGSIERFSAVLIEHLKGNFPLWLSPEQVRIVPVSDTHLAYARDVCAQLKDVGIRVELDDSKESMGKKIRGAKQSRLPYVIVIGDKEIEAQVVTLEKRGEEKGVQLATKDAIAQLKNEIEAKTL